MKKPLEIIKRNAFYSAVAGLMAIGLTLLTGCEPTAGGPPGAPPMGPPGAPAPGAAIGGHSAHTETSAVKRPVSSPANPIANAGPKAPGVATPPGVPGSPVAANAGGDDAAKPANADAGDPDKPGGADGSVNPMAPLSKVEQDGMVVELASEIIVAGANPFLDRLPKPVVETVAATDAGASGKTAAPPPPADPFASISVLGIAYHPKAPMALISVTGGDSQTRMVRKGDVLMVDAAEIKVIGIGSESVDLQRVGANTEKRTLNLPSIIGFGASTTASGKSGESGGAAGDPAASMPQAGAEVPGSARNLKNPMSRQIPDLSNLSKILPGAPSAPSVGPSKGANVSLHEP